MSMKRKFKNRALPRGILVEASTNLVYVRIFPNGNKFMKCYGNADNAGVMDTAISELAALREQIRLGKFKIEDKSQRILFTDAVDLFIKKHGTTWKYHFSDLKEFLGGMFLDEISYLKIRDYRPWRLQKDVEQTTVNRELTALSSLYTNFRRWMALGELRPIEMPKENPVTLVRTLKDGWYDETLNRADRILSNDEIEKFMAIVPERLQRATVIALNTGLRRKDMLAITSSNLMADSGNIRSLQAKVGTAHMMPSNANLNAALDVDGLEMSANAFRLTFERYRKRFIESGGKHFTWKDLRRTAAWRLWLKTKDIMKVRDFLGHKDAKTTQLYLGLTQENLAGVGEIMAKEFPFRVNTVGFKVA